MVQQLQLKRWLRKKLLDFILVQLSIVELQEGEFLVIKANTIMSQTEVVSLLGSISAHFPKSLQDRTVLIDHRLELTKVKIDAIQS